MRAGVAALAAVLLSGPLPALGAPAVPEPSVVAHPATFTVKLPVDQKLVFRGRVSFDEAGLQGGQMMYPAAGVAGLLVAVLAHGAIVESAKSSQRTKLQEAADKVLDAYKDALADFSPATLLQLSLAHADLVGPHQHVDAGGPGDADWVLASEPVFTLGQDQSVLILENNWTIHTREEPQKVLHQGVVKVVLNTRELTAPADYWGAEQARRLKEASAILFAHSLGLTLDQAVTQPARNDAPHKTYRYAEGKSEKMERGSLVKERCNRVVIKNLRGWLMSIPVLPSVDTATQVPPCSDPLAPPA